MQKIKQIIVADEVVAEVDIRVWEKSDFVVRIGVGQEILFRNHRIEGDIGFCEVLEGEDVLRKLRENAA